MQDGDVVHPVAQHDTEHDVCREQRAEDTSDRLRRDFSQEQRAGDGPGAGREALHRPTSDDLIDVPARNKLDYGAHSTADFQHEPN